MSNGRSTRLVEAIPSRMHRRIFLGSLSLNALIIGFMIGDALFIHPPQPLRAVEVSRNMLFDALPAEARQQVAELLRKDPSFRDLAETNIADLRAVLTADPFDPAALERLLSEKSERMKTAESVLQSALVDRLAALTAEDRREVAARLGRRP
ncbi:periplasmic heavy metal sensor [Rhizobium sp. RU36D]|uniref:periplasmic heavy metal sensor n=1 Tax=Rhizobium sp. RU36D TaxID=1907415 RepID=UPI0009D7ABAD|nr:periplasmic heavy metal sensor [Rhizobium sp. RU36D]SMD13749.1 Heavy-metal resistance [Rhizobium sp. RU36D]